MNILQSYMARKIDLLSINPFVRRVSKIYNTSETHSVPLRELYDHALIVVTEGKLNFAYKDKTVALGVGETILIPPFVQHKEFIIPGDKAKYFVLNFDLFYSPERAAWDMNDMYLKYCREGVAKMARDSKYAIKDENTGVFLDPVTMKVQNVNIVVEILQKMYEISHRMLVSPLSTEERITLKGYFLQIFAFLFNAQETKNGGIYGSQINNFIEYALENFQSEIDIDKKALKLGLSPNFFRKVFKEAVGITPFAYVLKIRLNEAKSLLLQGLSVRAVAEKVGFDDCLYFGKVFKKHVGVSPSVYKKRVNDNYKNDEYE